MVLFGAVSKLGMNHTDLKMVLFSWTVSTGLQDMQLKIERDDSDKSRGSREPSACHCIRCAKASCIFSFFSFVKKNLEPSHGRPLVLQLQCAILC